MEASKHDLMVAIFLPRSVFPERGLEVWQDGSFSTSLVGVLVVAREGGIIICRGYGYVPPIWVGFSVKNYLWSLFRQIFLRSRNWQKIIKMGSFPPIFIIKVSMMATIGN